MNDDAPAPRGVPVGEGERIDSIDVLRGVAVLGILVMNVRDFGMPLRAFEDPVKPRTLLITGALVFSVAIVFRQWPEIYRPIARAVFGARAKPPMSDAAAYHGSWMDLFHWRVWPMPLT